MRSNKWLGRLAALVPVIGSLVIVAPAPAQADDTCAAGRFCVWDTVGYLGNKAWVTNPVLGACHTAPFAVQSWKNETGVGWDVYVLTGCNGVSTGDIQRFPVYTMRAPVAVPLGARFFKAVPLNPPP